MTCWLTALLLAGTCCVQPPAVMSPAGEEADADDVKPEDALLADDLERFPFLEEARRQQAGWQRYREFLERTRGVRPRCEYEDELWLACKQYEEAWGSLANARTAYNAENGQEFLLEVRFRVGDRAFFRGTTAMPWVPDWVWRELP